MSARIGFVGLGVMGAPMAGHCLRAGHAVAAHNRSPEKARRFVAEHGGRRAGTPAEAADGAGLVVLCGGGDEDVRHVVTGPDGVLQTLRPGTVIVDHTTTSARLARAMTAAAAERDVSFLDAPVSGGQSGAEAGTLTVMAGGEGHAFDRARPVLSCYAKSSRLLGPSGSGQLAKMVNQLCIAGLVQGLAEGLHFARAAGLDGPAVVDVISRGAAQSWQMDHRAGSMWEGRFDFGFAVDWMRKDLGIALDEARRNGASLPVAALVDQLYAEVQAMGGGRWDTSSLMARLEECLRPPRRERDRG